MSPLPDRPVFARAAVPPFVRGRPVRRRIVPREPAGGGMLLGRTERHWHHLKAEDSLSMPDA